MPCNSIYYIIFILFVSVFYADAQCVSLENCTLSRGPMSTICDPSSLYGQACRLENPAGLGAPDIERIQHDISACGNADITLENPIYFTFMAIKTSANIRLKLNSGDWQDNPVELFEGLQIAVIRSCNTAESGNTVYCRGSAGEFGPEIDIPLTDLAIGQTYTLVLDGHTGDFGKFEFLLFDDGFGSFPFLEPVDRDIVISAAVNDTLCLGSDPIEFSIDASGTQFLQYATFSRWYIRDAVGNNQNGAFGTLVNGLVFNYDDPLSPGVYTIYAEVSDACGNEQISPTKTFVVADTQQETLAPYSFCESANFPITVDNRPDFNCVMDQMIVEATQTQLTCVVPSPDGCDTEFILPLELLSDEMGTPIDTVVCANVGSIDILGEIFLTSGNRQIPAVNQAANGCDLLVDVTVTYLDEITGMFDVEACSDGTATVTFVPSTTETLLYNWTWDDGEVIFDDDINDENRSIDRNGTINLEVTYVKSGRTCDFTFNQPINITPLALNPSQCSSANDMYTFSWDAIPGATYFIINENGDEAEVNGTTYSFPDDLSGNSVGLTLEARFPSCNTISEAITCISAGCPDFSFTIDNGDNTVCLHENNSDVTFSISNVNNAGGIGTVSWKSNGSGIIDEDTGVFDVDASGPGTYRIAAVYAEGGCRSNPVTAELTIIELTETMFRVPSDGCTSESVQIVFDSNPNINDSNWMVEGNPIIRPIDNTTWELTWDTPGDFDIAYQISQGNCTLTSISQSITIRDGSNLINNFTTPSNGCVNAAVNITFNRNPGISQSDWNVDGNPIIAQVNNTTWSMTWDAPGTYTIGYEVVQGQCMASSPTQTIAIQDPSDLEINFAVPNDGCTSLPVTVVFDSNPNLSIMDWIVDGNPTITMIDNTTWNFFWSVPGTYSVQYGLDQGGCMFMSTAYPVIVQDNNVSIDIMSCNPTLNSAAFEWTASPCFTMFEIFVDGQSRGQRSDNSFTVDDLAEGQTVTLEVMGIGSCLCGQNTITQSCTTLMAGDCTENVTLSCVNEATDQIDVAWEAPDCFDMFEVYLNGNLVETTSDREYSAMGLPENTAYDIDVLGIGSCGCNSVLQRITCRTTSIPNCTDNVVVNCDQAGRDQIDISWAAPPCYTMFEIRLDGLVETTVSDRMYSITNLDEGTEYTIEVVGIGDCGCNQVVTDLTCTTQSMNVCTENIIITCDNVTTSSATFSWATPDCYTTFGIIVNGIDQATQIERSITIPDLDQNERVDIEVYGIEDCGCAPLMATGSCTTTIDSGCDISLNSNCGSDSFEDQIQLEWDVNTDCFTSFIIYVDGVLREAVIANPSLSNVYMINDLEPDTAYDIEIEGIGVSCSCGAGRRFPMICRTSNGIPCETIEISCAQQNDNIRFDWQSSPCITDFEIYINNELTPTDIIQDSMYVIRDLVPNQMVSFAVRGFGEDCGCNIDITSSIDCMTTDLTIENCGNLSFDFTELGELCVVSDAKPIELIEYVSNIPQSGGIARWTGDFVAEGKLDIDLAPSGDGEINFRYEDGACVIERTLTYTKFESPEIMVLDVIQPQCPSAGVSFGSANVVVDGGIMPYTILVNDDSRELDELSDLDFIVGEDAIKNVIYVQDQNGCEITDTILIDQPPFLEAVLLGAETVRFGATERYEILIQDQDNVQIQNIIWEFSGQSGDRVLCDASCDMEYDLEITDLGIICATIFYNDGCLEPLCQPLVTEDEVHMFIPNIIGGTLPENQVFRVFTNDEEAAISTFRIFDRLGNEVFDMGEGEVLASDLIWDGRLNGQLIEAGVYVYHIELRHSFETEPTRYTGTLTVVGLRN